MGRLKRKQNKKRIRTLIITSLTLIIAITTGYAAFSTNLTLTAKANIYNINEKCFTTKDNTDGTVAITAYDETCGTDVVIPKTIKGKTVTSIANGEGWNNGNTATSKQLGAFANREIISVSFPDTIKTIGNFAFFGNNLTTLKLPDSITYIGLETFKNNQISFIEYSKNLQTISSLAFSTNKLTKVEVPQTVTTLGDGAYTGNKVTEGNPYIFNRNNDGTEDLTTLNSYTGDGTYIPEMPKVTTIGSFAFRDIYGNEEVVINLPDTITTINAQAFSWLHNLTINIPANIESINSSAFYRSNHITIDINRKENAIEGSPWGATNVTINWTGIK